MASRDENINDRRRNLRQGTRDQLDGPSGTLMSYALGHIQGEIVYSCRLYHVGCYPDYRLRWMRPFHDGRSRRYQSENRGKGD